jgi:hypothetical protein
MTPSSLTWEIARAGGFVAYALLTASVAIGLIVSLKWRSVLWTRFVTTELHRFVTILALVFTGIHTLAVAIDPFIRLSPPEVLVPLLSHYRPLWVALGVVGTYLLLAVYASEWIRPRIGYRWWHWFHMLSFVAFGLALVHGLGTGSDSRTTWAVGVYVASLVIVGALFLVRVVPPSGEHAHPIVAAMAASVLIVGGLWAWQGPLQPGWNAIANDGHGSGGIVGTVAAADPSSRPAPSPAPTPRPTPTAPTAFSDTVAGQLSQAEDGTIVLNAVLQSSGDRLTMGFRPSDDGRVVLEGASVALQASNGDTCSGTVSRVRSTDMLATCQGATSGARWQLVLALTSDQNDAVGGSLRATPLGS